jgi:hypothetical protein
MTERFFTQRNCDRCGNDLKNGRTMSMFNTDCLCFDCMDKEKQHPDYEKARQAEHEAVKRGDFNFKGIGL